jgi:hypothetical protein
METAGMAVRSIGEAGWEAQESWRLAEGDYYPLPRVDKGISICIVQV